MTVSAPENTTQEVSIQEKAATNAVQPTENVDVQKEQNFKAFREAREVDKAKRIAAEQKAAEKTAEVEALKAAMEAAFSKNAPSPQAYQQYYGTNTNEEGDTEDQRIEKKVSELLAIREEKQRRDYEEREQREYPNRLVKDFSDFNAVIAQENLDYIDFHYPEVSRPLQRLPEGYDKWADIYRAIKKFVPNNTTAKKEADKAVANFNKPKSMSSANVTPSGESTPYSSHDVEQRRAANWARMQSIIRKV
jgi:hypothetical protein